MPFSRFCTFFLSLFLGYSSLAATVAIASEPMETNTSINNTSNLAGADIEHSWLSNNNDFEVDLNYDSYNIAEGLSQSTVTSIVEDNDGYFWIGTINGLNRFDGTHFKHFFASETGSGLPSSFIRSLLIDQQGQLLIGTDKGLAIYKPETESFIAWEHKGYNLSEPIWSLEKNDTKFFIGMNNKLLIIDNNEITKIESGELKEIKDIKALGEEIFIRNYDGLVFRLKKGELSNIHTSSTGIELLNETLLITSPNGLFSYQNNIVEKKSAHPHSSIARDGNNLITLVNNKVNYIFNDFSEKTIGRLSPETSEFKRAQIHISKDNLLISYINKGFIHINESKNLVLHPAAVKGNIWSIDADDKHFYTASDSNIIKVYNHNFKEISSINSNSAIGPKTIRILNNFIYIGSATGLIKINLDNYSSSIISNEHISHLEISENNILIGTINGRLLMYDGGSDDLIEQIKLNEAEPIYDSLLDNGTTWIASQGGLSFHKNKKIKKVFEKEMVTSIEKTDGDIYFSARTSFYKVSRKNSDPEEIYNTDKITYSTIKKNNTLVSSSNGEILLQSLSKGNTIILAKENGTLVDYNIQSSMELDGKLVFGGTNGISIVDIESIFRYLNKKKNLEVNLSDLYLFNSIEKIDNSILNKSIDASNKITLKFSDYPFSFKFIVPGKALNEVEFYYQMQGLSSDWLPAKEVNSATYTNLSHGEYFFNVYAIDKLTGQRGPTKTLKVVITPPWWLSVEAKLIYALLTLLFLTALTRAVLRRRAVQKQIALSEERLKLSLWGSGDEMWDWDIESGNIFRSNIWGTLDFPQDGQRAGKLGADSNIHPQDQARVQAALDAHFKGETDHFEIAYRVKDINHGWIWILDRAKIVERDNNERPLRMTGTIKDINSIKQTEEQLRLFARAIENISEGMFILDSFYQFVEVNSACCELLLQEKSTFQGEILSFSLYPESFSAQIRQLIKQQGYWSGEVEAARADNTQFLMSLAIDSINNEQGEISHYVGVFSDITRRKQQEEELRKLTNNDILTGLPNRSSLQVTLSNLVKKDIHHTLMVLDLDNFKRINDSLGHQVGDDLLILVSQRIQSSIPSHASLYRLGGDEFAILLDNNPDIGSSAAIATNVIGNLKKSFEIQGDNLVIGLSIGIVLYPEDEQNEQALLRKADIAMYHAKSAGGNRYQFYSESLNQNVLRQLEVENLIREGLRDDLFEVHYQAKVNLKRDRITGMEALVRLKHPVHGLIPPNDFIPLAEDNGLIIEIGDLVLKKACTAAQKWREQGIFNGRIAVNLSSKQFALPDLVQRIESILRLTQLPANNLELEITEGTVIKNPESAIKVMQQLTKMGISLALDDFGTGYSSLSYLKRFPIHRLKVDKSFVDDIDKSDMDLKMVDSIITIAHNMGLTVVGEGVEQASQIAILRALNCEEIQGYIFSRPVPEADFTELLNLDASKDIQQAASDIESSNEFIKMKK